MPHPEAMTGPDRFAPELLSLDESERVSICEVLDRVLNKGVVVAGEITISVAGVDLLYLGLQLVLTSIETARTSLHGGQTQGGLSIDLGKKAVGRRRSHGARWNHAGRV
jgi:hypothetical protein